MIPIRKRAAEIALLVSGAALGGVVAAGAGRLLQLDSGRVQLKHYAGRLLSDEDQVVHETRVAVDVVLNDHLPFCSDDELSYLRKWVFNASRVRDIGRVKDDHLFCTTALGRLTPPPHTTPGDIVISGRKILASVPLLINPQARGVIIESSGVTVVLNPQDYVSLDQPPMYFSALIYDRSTGRVIPVAGHPTPLSPSEIAAQTMLERDGIYYQPMCSKLYAACIVAAEPKANMTALDRAPFLARLGAGAIMGALAVLTLILFFNRQRTLVRNLRRAIKKGQLSVRYQPVVDLDTGAVIGAEALVRWITEAGDAVPPEHFVAAAETKGFVGEITRVVIECVTEEIDDLLKLDDFTATVNITTQDLCDPRFFELVEQNVKSAKILPQSLGFELTERSTADRGVVIDAIERLRQMGHPVYIDDFGTGYSSLAYLHDLKINAIKIDRAFTSTVGTEAVTASVVPQILEMAAQLNLTVVVEGIETERQAAYFRSARGGIRGQGWLFGRPVPAAHFKRLFSDSLASSRQLIH
ncbi:MAG TPA: EAL domain-containing protein [Terracidiphilus sp.]|nr:EAL domain-containing protein [Terracidiphilus sp.]